MSQQAPPLKAITPRATPRSRQSTPAPPTFLFSARGTRKGPASPEDDQSARGGGLRLFSPKISRTAKAAQAPPITSPHRNLPAGLQKTSSRKVDQYQLQGAQKVVARMPQPVQRPTSAKVIKDEAAPTRRTSHKFHRSMTDGKPVPKVKIPLTSISISLDTPDGLDAVNVSPLSNQIVRKPSPPPPITSDGNRGSGSLTMSLEKPVSTASMDRCDSAELLEPAHPSTDRPMSVADLKQRMADRQYLLALQFDALDNRFQKLHSDFDVVSSRTEPPPPPESLLLSPKIPTLCLSAAKTMIREETVEGAMEIDYMEDAKSISMYLKKEKSFLSQP